MKFDPDCARDILLAVEASDCPKRKIILSELRDTLPSYGIDDLEYTCLKLFEAGMLDIITGHVMGRQMLSVGRILDITYTGHQFLENVRNEKVWNKTKKKAKAIGSFALDVISQIAVNVISSKIG